MSEVKKEYVPPVAEVILLAPTEKLAVNDYGFGKNWWAGPGYFSDLETRTASAVGIHGGGTLDASNWDEDGYTIKKQ